MRALVLLMLISTACSSPTVAPENFDWQGHRGARGVYPENTIPAFKYALEQGMTTLEMDVVVTADSQVILSHEPFMNHQICLDPAGNSIEESKEKRYNIFQMNYAEVRQYDCGSKGHPDFPDQKKISATKPTLEAVIDTVEEYAQTLNRPRPFYNIEIKSRLAWDDKYHPEVSVYADLVMREVQKAGIQERVSIQSFDKRALQYMHKNYPEIKLVLLEVDNRSPQLHLKELGFRPDVYSCYYKKVDKQLVQFCHQEGMKVIPWTVNETKEVKRLIELGVDGIITDYPAKARQLKLAK